MKTIMKVKKKLLIVLLIMCIPLLGFVIFNFNGVSKFFLSISHQLKLALVDVSNLEVSTLLIDISDGSKRYNDSYTWNATAAGEYKNISYQVNYKQSTSFNTYKAGELEIEVPNLLMILENASPTYYTTTTQNYISISADKDTDEVKKNDWSYHYSSDNTKIIFTNNIDFNMNQYYEGSIQVTYKLTATNIDNNKTSTFKAKLNNKESNSISFAFTSNKSSYSMSVYSYSMESLDNVPAGDYIWVRQWLYPSKGAGVRYLYNKSTTNGAYINIDVPEGVVVYNDNMTELSKKDGKYYFSAPSSSSSIDNIFNQSIYSSLSSKYIVLGIPKSTYYDKTISLTYKMYGIYTKTNYNGALDSVNDGYEQVLTVTKSIKVSSYEFHYSGDSYGIRFSSLASSKHLDPYLMEKSSEKRDYDIIAETTYSGTKYDVVVGFDLFLYHDVDGSVRRLNDDEVSFSSIEFPSSGAFFDNTSGQNIPNGKYDVDFYVRYEGDTSYTKFDSFKNTGKTYSASKFPKNVVAYYFVVHDMVESIDSLWSENIVSYKIKNANPGSSVYRFCFLKIYVNGVLNNPVADSSYSSSLLKQYVQPYDIQNHGSNVQRAYESTKVNEFIDLVSPTTSLIKFDNERDKYTSTATVSLKLGSNCSANYCVSDSFKGYELYIQMPPGTYLDTSQGMTQSFGITSANLSKIKKSDGSTFSSLAELDNFFKSHQTIEIVNKHSSTGAQLIKVVSDFADEPLNNEALKTSGSPDLTLYTFTLPIYTTKDSLEEHGYSVKVTAYSKTFGYQYTTSISNFSKDSNDINQDGNTNEYLAASSSSKTILIATASNQDIVTYVETDQDPFTSYTGTVSRNATYTYKLRTRNLNNKITNLVIYDSIEKYVKKDDTFVKVSGDNNTFKGTFVDVDTSYATSKGYKVKVYYSESEQPGKLGVDTSWKEYSTSVDKTKVKSLAFEYLNSSNGKAVLPEDSLTYVEVIMKSPSEVADDEMKTFNASWSEWTALDASNNTIGNINLYSTITEVDITSVVNTNYIDVDTNTALAPTITKEYKVGETYTTSGLTTIPEGYRLIKQTGDSPSGTVNKSTYSINYIYKIVDPKVISSDVELTAPTSIDKRNSTVNYSVSYNAEVKDLIDNTSIQLTMNLPYEIDLTKSSLDGGTYNSTNKTITWNHTNTTDEYKNETINYTHDISLVYMNIPIVNIEFTTSVNSSLTHNDASKTNEDSKDTNIEEKYKVTIKYIDVSDNSNIIDPVEQLYLGGSEYNTSPEVIEGYDLISEPTNKTGTVNAEEIEVIYTYRLLVHTITNKMLNDTYTTNINKRTDTVSYSVEYEVSVKDFIGDSTITIVESLPYEIDLTKSSIEDGTYNSTNKTITWNHTLTTDSYDEVIKKYKHDISVAYKDVLVYPNSFTNRITCTLVSNTFKKVIDTTYTTTINEKYPVTVKYLEYGTEKSIIDDKVDYYLGGEDYTTTPEDIDVYDLKSTPINQNGKVESESTEVIYYYEKRDPVISSSIDESGSESLESRDGLIEYNIAFNPEIKDYIGTVLVKIEDILPYEIDEDKSELNGGVYDETSKTITWTDSFETLSSDVVTKDYNYTIKIMYKDIDPSVDIINNVEGTVILTDRTITRSTTYSTAITIPGTIKVKYIDVETEEEIEEEVKSVNIIKQTYYPTSKYIEGYYLVGTPESTSYIYDEEEQTVYYKYKKISTKVEEIEPPQKKIDENPQTGIFDYISYIIMSIIVIAGVIITLNVRKKKMFRRV